MPRGACCRQARIDKAAANPQYKDPVAALPFGQIEANEELVKANPDYRAMEEHDAQTHVTLMFVSGFISIAGIFLAFILAQTLP